MFINNNHSSGSVSFQFTVYQMIGNGFQAAFRLASQSHNMALSEKEYLRHHAEGFIFPVEQSAALALEVELE
jgi:hypothetical protein